MEVLRGQLGMFHLLGETRLLGLQHVGKEVIEFEALHKGKGSVKEMRNEGIAEGDFVGSPTSCARCGGIVERKLEGGQVGMISRGRSVGLPVTGVGGCQSCNQHAPLKHRLTMRTVHFVELEGNDFESLSGAFAMRTGMDTKSRTLLAGLRIRLLTKFNEIDAPGMEGAISCTSRNLDICTGVGAVDTGGEFGGRGGCSC
mmetsp:Transcript_12325/g.26023  ORF Transcript_12325/g.26023 Transcript_12325/m.26023 type:complete len:200 (-) Transcript_12325:678-1277(-)